MMVSKERIGMKRPNEKGTALLLTLILVLVLSVMAASMMFLAQSETWSSANYRLMTQARYGAEAGLHAAANYLTNSYTGIGTSDPISAYAINASPVTYGGSPVFLSSLSGVASNYPVSAVKTAFTTASTGSLSAGANAINYTTSAKLLSMRTFLQCGNAQPVTAQLWKLTSHGDIGGVRSAEVEVSALLESHVVPCYQYAAFATSTGCGAINWSGGGPINSYDSSNVAAGVQAYDGNVGSNGNANVAPHTSITGNFSSPETGVGACSSGDAISGATPATISQYISDCEVSTTTCGTNYLNQLPQTVIYKTPVTAYPTGVVESTLTAPNGTLDPNNCGVGLASGCYGDITGSITLQPYLNPVTHACSSATYYINTISLNGTKTLTVGPCPAGTLPVSAVGTYQPIILNVVDVNNSGGPISIGGGSVANASLNPANLQIQYAGTGTISIHGGSSAAALLYAPNAPVTLNGANSDWYGALITSTLTLNGNGASVHYDRRLATGLSTVGNWTMDTFTWSKY
jgi:Tfp pilus assembly protein PilX